MNFWKYLEVTELYAKKNTKNWQKSGFTRNVENSKPNRIISFKIWHDNFKTSN